MLACDGIWDCVTNEEYVKKLSESIKKVKATNFKQNVTKPVEELLQNCLAKDTTTSEGIGTDNMTAMLIVFHHNMGFS